jgi:hypothetical protein
MVSSLVVFTDITVGLRRAVPHRAAALDPSGSRLISGVLPRLRHKRPAAARATRMARGLLRLCAGVVGGRWRGRCAHDERIEIEPNHAIATVIDGV